MKRIILSVLALGATGVAMAQVNPQKGYVTTKFDDLEEEGGTGTCFTSSMTTHTTVWDV